MPNVLSPSKILVPMAGIGPATSPLPRECSTTEPHGHIQPGTPAANHRKNTGKNCSGAGEGNRTLVVSLEGFCSTIELHPRNLPPRQPIIQTPAQLKKLRYFNTATKTGGGGRIRTIVLIRGQIYSLLPLTTRPPLRKEPAIIQINTTLVKGFDACRHRTCLESTATSPIHLYFTEK
jgi:hypothetical protein